MIKNAVDEVMKDYIFRDSTGDQKRPKLIEIAQTVMAKLPTGGKILDFGSGFGDVPAVLSLLGYECVALDDFNDPWHTNDNVKKILAFSEKYNIKRVNLATDSIADAGDDFDMVMIHDVLEHLHDSPRDILLNMLKLTNSTGMLYASVPNAGNIRKRISLLIGGTNHPHYDHYYWHPHPYRGHVREYVKGDFIRMAKWLDLEILELSDLNQMLAALNPVSKFIWKNISFAFPGCKDTWQFIGQKSANWNPISEADSQTIETRISEMVREVQDMSD